jgi:hypothetical protein
MLILSGILRQSGEVTIKERPMVKLWVEHTSPRDNGTDDLRIEELFLEERDARNLPAPGRPISVAVRAYPRGRDIGFSAVGIVAEIEAQTA